MENGGRRRNRKVRLAGLGVATVPVEGFVKSECKKKGRGQKLKRVFDEENEDKSASDFKVTETIK